MKFYFLSGCCLLMFIYSDVYQYLLMFTGHTATNYSFCSPLGQSLLMMLVLLPFPETPSKILVGI